MVCEVIWTIYSSRGVLLRQQNRFSSALVAKTSVKAALAAEEGNSEEGERSEGRCAGNIPPRTRRLLPCQYRCWQLSDPALLCTQAPPQRGHLGFCLIHGLSPELLVLPHITVQIRSCSSSCQFLILLLKSDFTDLTLSTASLVATLLWQFSHCMI